MGFVALDARTTVLFLWAQSRLLLCVYREIVRHFASQERLWKSVNTSRNRSLVVVFFLGGGGGFDWTFLDLKGSMQKFNDIIQSPYHSPFILPRHFNRHWIGEVLSGITQKPVACHCGDRCRDSHVPRIVLSALCRIAARYLRITPPEVTAVRWQMLWLLTTRGNPFVLLVKP